MPPERHNSKTFQYLGVAIAVSVLLAFPIEQTRHFTYIPSRWRGDPSCGSAVELLDLGVVVQAILIPLLVFLLPGSGSIIRRKLPRSALVHPFGWRTKGTLFLAAGWLSAAAVAIGWWYVLKDYAEQHGLCSGLFNASRPADFLRVDDLYDSYRYFLCLSVFTTVWVGIAATGQRLRAEQSVESSSRVSELHAFRDFFWVYLLGWAVQYRLCQWLGWPTFARGNGDWLPASALNFVFLTSSALWSLAFIRWFWNMRLQSRGANIWSAFGVSCLIPFLNLLTFSWAFFLLLYYLPLTLTPLFMLNVTGFAWAWTVGSRRWQVVHQRSLAPVGNGESELRQKSPALSGLKIVQIVGIGIALLFFLAFLLVSAAYLWFLWTSKNPQRG